MAIFTSPAATEPPGSNCTRINILQKKVAVSDRYLADSYRKILRVTIVCRWLILSCEELISVNISHLIVATVLVFTFGN